MDLEGNGIHLCYGQRSGYGGYGDWIRGAREIVVTEEMLEKLEVETYIRLETGDVVGQVMLNSTFNDDWYPATPNTMTYMSEETDSGSASILPRSESAMAALGGSLAAIAWLSV
jgi:hypothetical protein